MGHEYRIRFPVPSGYLADRLASKLPDPIVPKFPWTAYDFKVEDYGFYFLNHGGEPAIASIAFKALVKEALCYTEQVIVEAL